MANSFTFNGRCSADFDLFVEHFPNQSKPARKVTAISIPGRNGALILDDGGYENVTVRYQCYFRGGPERATEIAEWLLSGDAKYLRLEDTYHTGYFRKALFAGPMDIENHFNRKGRVTLEFNCLPELWLISGEEQIVIDLDIEGPRYQQFEIVNPTAFPSKPLIRLVGMGGTTINIDCIGYGSESLVVGVFSKDYDDYVDIDCEMCNCYKGSALRNNIVELSLGKTGFLSLGPGKNIVSSLGWQAIGAQTISQIIITPRWWRL